MPDPLPTPWNFNDKNSSPDNFHTLVYYNLIEVAMGAPLRGECYLETSDKQKIKIHDSCGEPPAWKPLDNWLPFQFGQDHREGGCANKWPCLM